MKMKITSTSVIELLNAVEVHGCKCCVTNLSIIPLIICMLTANITYYSTSLEYVHQVNSHKVQCNSCFKISRVIVGAVLLLKCLIILQRKICIPQNL